MLNASPLLQLIEAGLQQPLKSQHRIDEGLLHLGPILAVGTIAALDQCADQCAALAFFAFPDEIAAKLTLNKGTISFELEEERLIVVDP
jgi:hypothetical protein